MPELNFNICGLPLQSFVPVVDEAAMALPDTELGVAGAGAPPPAYQLYHIVAAFLFWSESLNPPLWGRMRGCENDLAITLTFAVVLVALRTEFKGSTVTPDGISSKSVAVRWRVDVYEIGRASC